MVQKKHLDIPGPLFECRQTPPAKDLTIPKSTGKDCYSEYNDLRKYDDCALYSLKERDFVR